MRQFIKTILPEFVLKGFHVFQKEILIICNKGDNVFCEICGSKFKKFLTFGKTKRINARCPNCGSLERHRLMWKYLNEKTNFFSSKHKIKLLHFAPEKFFYDIFSKNQNINYFPCDLLPENYSYDGSVKITKVNITNIPFDENHFDVVLCNHVLEHIPDDRLAMSELFRVMKKGAWGIFLVPIDYNREFTYEDFTITTPKGREEAFGQFDHVRWYGKDYKNKLEKVGFIVKEDDFSKSLSSSELFKYGLVATDCVYYCKK